MNWRSRWTRRWLDRSLDLAPPEIRKQYTYNMKKISSNQVFSYHQEYLFYSFPLYKHFIINVSTFLLHSYLSSGLFYWCRFSLLQACPTLWRTSWALPRWRWRFPEASPAVSWGGSAHSTGPTPRWPRTTAWPHCCPPVTKTQIKVHQMFIIYIYTMYYYSVEIHTLLYSPWREKRNIIRENKFNTGI